MKNFLKRITLYILNNCLRKSKILTWLLFQVKVNDYPRIHWDFTTIILKHCLKRCVRHSSSVLEIGTGPYAVLAIYLSKKIGCKISAADILTDFIRNAKIAAELNHISINLFQSDLFSQVHNSYDLIFFNSVYIPENQGLKLGLDKLHRDKTEWCGGPDGLNTIDEFLHQAQNHLHPAGKILLGFNPHYLPLNNVLACADNYNYNIIKIYRKKFNPCRILILERKP